MKKINVLGSSSAIRSASKGAKLRNVVLSWEGNEVTKYYDFSETIWLSSLYKIIIKILKKAFRNDILIYDKLLYSE